MSSQPGSSPDGGSHPHRLDVPLHKFLMDAPVKSSPPESEGQTLPDPVFPQYPEVLASREEDLLAEPNAPPLQRHWTPELIYKTMRGWLFPYVRSRVMPGEFHPIIAYLFTEWKCNLDCHYCWAYNNSVKGMTEDVARRSLDWLHDTGGRVLALMGGEPLLRPQFIHKVVYYATKRGFWVYLPTNGRLLRPEVTDWLGDAGVATINLAVDSVDVKPSLPKALVPIRPYFDYLIKRQYRYGFTVFFNINICRNNIEDVKQLTEIAHDHGISTDYHLNESPMLEQDHFKHNDENSTYITPEDHGRVGDLIDWIIDKNRAGYKMVDSVTRLQEMKAFMRGERKPWQCRAGQNSLIVRVDGTLAPCFPMYSATYDWGTVGNHKFEVPQLDHMKESCTLECFSTLNNNLAMAYDDARVIRWVWKQVRRGFQGVSGSIE